MSEKSGSAKVELDPTVDFFAGTVAGVAALIVGFPFDTVKVRFQNPTASSVKYNSTFQALSTILREEKFRGLYKGISSPLVTAPLMNGLVFSTYRFFMKLQMRHDGQVPSIAQIGLAGAACGVVSSLITTPIELLKIQQQQAAERAALSRVRVPPAHVLALEIFRLRGLRGLYRGITATALRDTGYGAYFAGYEGALRVLAPQPAPAPTDDPLLDEVSETLSQPWWALLLAGGFAGVAGWAATFPFDVVKTRVQSAPDGGPGGAYRSTRAAVVSAYREGGARVFFNGLAPTLIRAVPVNMVVFATFEGVVHLCS
ncbi:mitochondrial carrier [Artomyces pyxidatus]|uniref:Mitochondrial carrier n=1 Tax=Artomyces pyxidatus TaxID=48021 RepID=A0ACB8TB19_9AGAM|nr:mitochondrial carrier [Artomyces pyxidatus]